MTSCQSDSGPGDTDAPEIDIIDGESFMSFETWAQVEEYTRANKRHQRLRLGFETPTTSSSAFVSKTLDDFLKQAIGRSPAATHSASPPCDSRIYETGVLKMDSVRKPFADLPHLSQVRDSPFAPPQPPPLLNIGVENSNPLPQKAVNTDTFNSNAKRKKVALNDFDPDKVTAEQMEKTTNSLFREAAKQFVLSRKPCYISFQMDEAYSLRAIDSLNASSAEPAEQDVPSQKNKKWNKRGKNCDDAVSLSKSAKETDLIAMISRKRDSAKRDIRLPSRYQESVLVEGNSWICDAQFGSDNPVEKRPRKRLIDEQKRLLVLKQPVTDTPQVVRNTQPDKQVFPVKRKRPQQPAIRQLPDARIPSPAKRKQPLIPKMTAPQPLPPPPLVRPLPQIPVPAPIARKNTGTNEDLKQLYRELFYACGSGRREHFQQRFLKPRVNKPQTVNEAVELIKRLQIRERQLLYIKQLLSLWHRKLDLCSQVINDKVRPEPNPRKDTKTVVFSVLKAYRESFCYKLSATLPKLWNRTSGPLPIAALPDQERVSLGNGLSSNSPAGQSGSGSQHDEDKTDVPKEQHLLGVQKIDRRSKKIRSQSLLIPKYQHQVPHVPIPRILPQVVPAQSESADGQEQQSRGVILNISSEAHDVVVDGKQFKQFVWANNQQVLFPDQLIPKNGSDVVSRIMSSN